MCRFGIDKVEGEFKQTSYVHSPRRDASAAVIRLSPRARRTLIEQRSPITREGRRIAGRLRIGLSNLGWVGRDFPSPHTRIYPQTFHPTLAPMTEHGHQNLSLMNEKLKFLHIYTRCFLDGIIPIQNNSTPFSSILNYETLNHKSVKEKDL